MSSMQINLLNNIFKFVVLFLPIFFAVGPALVETASLLFFFIFLFLWIEKKADFISLVQENKKIIYLFIIFWTVLLISSFTSADYYLSFKNTAFYFRFLTYSLIILYILNKYNKLHHSILNIYLILFIIIFFSSLFELKTGNNFFNNSQTLNGRITSIFLDEQVLGSFIVKSLPVIIALVYFSKTLYKNSLILALVIIGFVITILSGERSAFLLFIVVMAFSLRIKEFKSVFYFLILFFFIILIFNSKFLNLKSIDRIINHSMKQIGINSLSNNERLRIFSEVHEYHYVAGLKMFLDNKFLGVGPNNFRKECIKDKYLLKKVYFMDDKIYAKDNGFYIGIRGNYHYFYINDDLHTRSDMEISINETLLSNNVKKVKNIDGSVTIQYHFKKNDHIFSYKKRTKISGCNTHPHNYLIQFLSEIGMIGFIFYLILVSYCIYKILLMFIKNNRNDYPEYFIYISILISLFPILPSGNFFNNMNSFIIFWNLPFYLYFKKHSVK